MCIELNLAHQETGTRFRVFAQSSQHLQGSEPEVIWVSIPAGSVGPGPSDERMVVRDARDKLTHYTSTDGPPWFGPVHPPALPDALGHFDHLPIWSRQFSAAHMYAVIRRVLDVWETYFDRTIAWHFEHRHPQLELIPQVFWDNAQSGFGFIESGFRDNAAGQRQWYCLNFDVLAHEIGHSIIYSEVGWPSESGTTPDYQGFHEAAADLTALIAALHFDSVIDRLLAQTRGNLYALNELNRIAEMSDVEQIRVASNDARMSDYTAGWRREHELSLPLSGALFDVLVEVYHRHLVERGLIDPLLAKQAYDSVLPGVDPVRLQRGFDAAFRQAEPGFRLSLLEARDTLGTLLAQCWTWLDAENLTYADVGHALIDADLTLFDGQYNQVVFDCLRWREIGQFAPGPRLQPAREHGVSSCR